MAKKHNTLIFTLTLSFFLGVLLVPAGQALGATVYQYGYIGESLGFGGSDPYAIQIMGTNYAGGSPASSDGINVPSSFDTIRIKRVSGQSCADLDNNAVLWTTGYSSNINLINGTANGDYCGFSTQGGSKSAGVYQAINIRGNDTAVVLDGWTGLTIGKLTTSNGYEDPSYYGGFYMEFCDSGTCTGTPTAPPPTDTTTRIITITPPHDIDGSNARATSTTFAFESTGYINPDDFRDGLFVQQKWIPNDYNQLASAYCAIGGCYTVYEYDISASGSFSVATTTDVQRVGWYTLITTIYAPRTLFGVAVPFWNDPLVASSTDFLVATSSPIDNIKRTIASSTTAIITGSESPTRFCDFADFVAIFDFNNESNILTCLLGVVSGLTVPSSEQITAIGQNLDDSIGTRWPFGYFTRFVELALDPTVATTTLPTLTIGTPDELPYIGGISGTFDLYGDFMGSTSLIATATSSPSTGSKTLRQIIEPGWNIIVMLLLAIAIVWDMLRIKRHSH